MDLTALVATVSVWAAARLGAVVLGGGLLLAVLFTAALWLALAQRRLRAHYHALAAGVDGANLEQLLNQHLSLARETRRDLRLLRQEVTNLAACGQDAVQHVGLVRYDAFGDVGGRVSFAVALLDAHFDGVLLNCVASRESSSLYAKPVRGGQSEIALATEETEALRHAQRAARTRAARPTQGAADVVS